MRYLPKPKTLDVLFVAYGGGHIQTIIPVARRMHELGCVISIFAVTTAVAVVEASGLPYFSYSDLPQANNEDVKQEGTRLAAEFPSGGPVPYNETCAYMGINFTDLIQQYGRDRASELYGSAGRQIFFPLSTMTDLLNELQPKLVVATNSPRSEQAVLQAAVDMGLQSLCIVDMFAMQEVAWLKAPGFGTKICVLNDGVKRMLIDQGRPAEEIVITGNPAFDGIYDLTVLQHGRKLKQKRCCDEHRFSILYASTPEPSRHPFTGEIGDPGLPFKVEKCLREILSDRDDVELVLRRHPSEDQEIAPGERIFASPRSEDVNALIHSVDLVIVTCSTVGLQAYLAGVPLISVECSVISKDAPYGKFGMSRMVPSIDLLKSSLIDEINRQRMKRMSARRDMDPPSAPAAIAVCAEALQLLNALNENQSDIKN